MNALVRGFVWMALAAAIGCEENRPAPVATPPAGPPVPPVAAPVQPAAAPVPPAAAPVPPPAAPAPAPEVEMVREKAAVGMGEKGRGYGGDGFISTPIKTLWQTKERLALMQIDQAIQIYKASDGEGHGPKSHQEFMDKIIKAHHIPLPELPQGHRYVYDPAKEELLVEQPK